MHTRPQQTVLSLSTGILVFLVYLPTVMPDLTWASFSGDGGELITAAVTLGIPHPPGYPTYVLLGKVVSYLPVEPVAYRFHLFSAVCVAIAAGFLTATSLHFLPKPATLWQQLSGIAPALLFAFSSLAWGQATVAEVYGLNIAIVAAFLWALLGERRSYLLCGFLFGLSLTTHLTSIFLLPLAILHLPGQKTIRFAVGTFAGLTPFLTLPLLARLGSPVIWGNPTTFSGWWWLVSAQIYRANQFALPLDSMGTKLSLWPGTIASQLAFVGWPLLVYSGWVVKNGRSIPKKTWWGLVGTAVLFLGYAFFYNTQDSIILTLPAWLILSLSLKPSLNRWQNWQLLLPGIALLLHLLRPDGANIHNIRYQVEEVFAKLPENAILMTSGDPDIFTMWYFHYVEDQRSDIVLVDTELFAFDWYRQNLQTIYPSLQVPVEDDLPAFTTINRLIRPICQVALNPLGSAAITCVED